MKCLIEKSALVAEIKNRIKELQNLYKEDKEKLDSIQKTAILLCIDECMVILSFINSLEVKEVNEVPATVMVNKYGNRFISSWSGLKEYDDLKEREEIKILIPKK